MTTTRSATLSLTIKEQSHQLKAASAGRLPPEVAEAFARDQERLLGQGRPPDAVAAGDVLEEFTLPDARGTEVSLSELVADGPAVLVFYRGGWCPFCNLAFTPVPVAAGPAARKIRRLDGRDQPAETGRVAEHRREA
jgi:hypothetical protein